MKTLAPLALSAALLSACVVPEGGSDPVVEDPYRDISPAARAALPQGMSPGFLIKDANGCYGVALEDSEVPSGPPLRGPGGIQVCDAI